MTDHIQVTTTVENRAGAQAIAAAVLQARLAACVQVIGPVNSTYRWRGKVETTEEWLCVIKSRPHQCFT